MEGSGKGNARQRANQRWDAANLKRFTVAMPNRIYDMLSAFLKTHDETRNGFVNKAVEESILDRCEDDGYETLHIRMRTDGKWYAGLTAAARAEKLGKREYVTKLIQKALVEGGYVDGRTDE